MGGGAMRSAAKAAVLGGYRSATPVADAAAARRASQTPAVAVAAAPASGGDCSIAVACFEGYGASVMAGVHRPSWELDEWEFAGGKEEELFDMMHPAPRHVFGPVPTFEQAKEATADLKDAIEKVYFSSNTTDGSTKRDERATLHSPSPLETSENKGCILSENLGSLSSVPKQIVQAFSLLQGSPEAQSVVASLASDKNIWDAMMNNEKVMEFYKTYQSTVLPPEKAVELNESFAENESIADNQQSSLCSETPETRSSQASSEISENDFMDFVQNIKSKVAELEIMQNIKSKVTEIVSNLSYFFQDIMKNATEGRSSMSAKIAASSNVDIIGSSFMALAIAVIMVVLLKRV